MPDGDRDMQAVILAGGKGTRLASRLNGRPKPLVDVDGIPLLERQVVQLARQGVTEVVVLVNHAADQIERFFAGRGDLGATVTLVDDGDPRGTSGAVLACLDRLRDRFLVVYGDTLFDIDIAAMLRAHEAHGAVATLLLHPNDHPADSDLVEVDEAGRITAFHPYPHPPGAWLQNLVNAAFYVVEERALAPYRDFRLPSDFAKDLFPRMVADGAVLHGYNSYEYIKDLGTPKRLDKVERHLREGVVARARRAEKQVAVFVDRDGTLNVLRDYVRTPEDLELLPGATAAVKRLNEIEHRVVVVTNQPVLARGEASFETLRRIHARLDTELGEGGAYVDALYFCPHHPHGGFPGEVASLKVACDCRKPRTGMIDRAVAELNIDRTRSWMVGDSTGDVLAGSRAGLRTVLLDTGEGGRDGRYAAVPDYTVPDFAAAVRLIADQYPRLAAALGDLPDTIGAGELVLVGGLARSGKSTLAATLAAELRARGRRALTVAMDRWIRPPAERRPGVLGRFDLDAMLAALEPWLAGGDAAPELPFYDRFTRTTRAAGKVALDADTVLILEGVPALLLDPSTSRRVHRLHVASDESVRRDRVIGDLVARGAGPDEAARIYDARAADETPVVLAARAAAERELRVDGILRTADAAPLSTPPEAP
ncbi:HAD-IIIA family hydrolase [Roseomonas sp. NAR14]|uniref:D,D-heptose 1,7-bisphosphate phosphatase n=1 Tax=Roseomonas acroporae TaxID=2937791 RepID=A0A9X2BTZ7_9PROT|nr:HAD-IIIA family hydrolase [Roseomonas acroporae]MCK8785173.1 HAD-IIIA family hydrolase [Roseomonas acroporae]